MQLHSLDTTDSLLQLINPDLWLTAVCIALSHWSWITQICKHWRSAGVVTYKLLWYNAGAALDAFELLAVDVFPPFFSPYYYW